MLTPMQYRIVEVVKELRDCYEDWTEDYNDCERALIALHTEFRKEEPKSEKSHS